MGPEVDLWLLTFVPEYWLPPGLSAAHEAHEFHAVPLVQGVLIVVPLGDQVAVHLSSAGRHPQAKVPHQVRDGRFRGHFPRLSVDDHHHAPV